MAQTRQRLSGRQLFYFMVFFVVAFTVGVSSISGWDQLYSSNPVIFAVLLVASLSASIASNLVAHRLTVAHISKIGIQGEANPFQRALYTRFGLGSGYPQVLIGLPVAYAILLLLFSHFRVSELSFAFTFAPLLLSYDALQDYLVVRVRKPL
jgi:hypothetical protein